MRYYLILRSLCVANYVFLFAAIDGSVVGLNAGTKNYEPDIAKWQEVQPPPKSRRADWEAWFSAANYSNVEWQIKSDGNVIRAHLTSNPVAQSSPRPNFIPKAEKFAGSFAVQRVNDGWLVGFNEGEFGAALYWFSHDGRQKYKISDDQVVDFMVTPQGIVAIQGLAHLFTSEGSLIRVARNPKTGRWGSSTIKKFSEAPYAFARLSSGTLIVVLSDSLVSLKPDNQLRTLIKPSDWSNLYPNSGIISRDESKLYIGMRQFVVEVDLRTNNVKYLVPNRTFLNKRRMY